MPEYEALMIGWEKTHESKDTIEAPDVDFVRSEMERLKNSPITR
jgi:hypothetical protein